MGDRRRRDLGQREAHRPLDRVLTAFGETAGDTPPASSSSSNRWSGRSAARSFPF